VTLCENRFCNYLLIKKLRFTSVEDGFEKKAGDVFFCGPAESRVDMGRRQFIML